MYIFVGDALDFIVEIIGQSQGPTINATKADAVRFHDDPSTYTGAHAKGGPSFEQGSGPGVTLENLLDRSGKTIFMAFSREFRYPKNFLCFI